MDRRGEHGEGVMALGLPALTESFPRQQNPAAGMMFRMVSVISQNPDKEFEVKPPPLEVSNQE